MNTVRILAAAICFLCVAERCRADEFKPTISPGFYHIHFQISDMVMSRVIEIRDVRPDKILRDGGFMDVTWVGMWPDEPNTFIHVEAQNRIRTTGVLNPKAIQLVIPDVQVSRKIDVYYFTFEPTPDKHGAYTGTGDVPYDGPNGAGKNRFTCEMTPLPDFKVPKK